MTDKKYIYALYYEEFASPESLEEGPDDITFYIGHTENPKRRLQQHKNSSKKRHEDNYKFIRKLESMGKEWDMQILHETTRDDKRPWEYWYIIKAIREGSPLKNMKYGDFKKIDENRLKKYVANKKIDSVENLQSELENDEKNYAVSEQVQYKAILKSLRWLRTENRDDVKINIYDLGEGTDEIIADFYMKKTEVAALHTPAVLERFRKLEEMIQGIRK